MTQIELLKDQARQQEWRGQAQLEALNLAETVGKPDINGERISESILAGLFWDIIHAGNFNYYMVEDFLQLYAGEDADDQVREAA